MTNQKCKMSHIGKGIFAPKLCECGGYSVLAGGKNVASFFLDPYHGEYVCSTCGAVLNRYGEYV